MAGAGRRISKSSIDWAKFAERIPENQTTWFKNFQGKSFNYVSRMNSLPTELPKIDWAVYKKRVPSLASTIDQFEKQYKSLNVPYPEDKDNVKGAIAKQEKDWENTFKKLMSNSNNRIEQSKQKLAKWDKIPPFDHMTKEEWNHYFPEHAEFHPKQMATFWPHGPEEHDQEKLAKQSDYKVPIRQHH